MGRDCATVGIPHHNQAIIATCHQRVIPLHGMLIYVEWGNLLSLLQARKLQPLTTLIWHKDVWAIIGPDEAITRLVSEPRLNPTRPDEGQPMKGDCTNA